MKRHDIATTSCSRLCSWLECEGDNHWMNTGFVNVMGATQEQVRAKLDLLTCPTAIVLVAVNDSAQPCPNQAQELCNHHASIEAYLIPQSHPCISVQSRQSFDCLFKASNCILLCLQLPASNLPCQIMVSITKAKHQSVVKSVVQRHRHSHPHTASLRLQAVGV